VDAARVRVAGVGGAFVVVITICCRSTLAGATRADIVGGARVAVVAGRLIGRIDAPRIRNAAIVGAGVAIIAIEVAASSASSINALVLRGAGIFVVARVIGGKMEATLDIGTNILSAGIVIVAGQFLAADAAAQMAVVSCCAGISIVAGYLVQIVEAAIYRVAGVICAEVVVVATKDLVEAALTVEAVVPGGAGVAIVAFPVGGGIRAASSFALVHGTRIAVITVDLLSVGANAPKAFTLDGTWIPVVAEKTLVG